MKAVETKQDSKFNINSQFKQLVNIYNDRQKIIQVLINLGYDKKTINKKMQGITNKTIKIIQKKNKLAEKLTRYKETSKAIEKFNLYRRLLTVESFAGLTSHLHWELIVNQNEPDFDKEGYFNDSLQEILKRMTSELKKITLFLDSKQIW